MVENGNIYILRLGNFVVSRRALKFDVCVSLSTRVCVGLSSSSLRYSSKMILGKVLWEDWQPFCVGHNLELLLSCESRKWATTVSVGYQELQTRRGGGIYIYVSCRWSL